MRTHRRSGVVTAMVAAAALAVGPGCKPSSQESGKPSAAAAPLSSGDLEQARRLALAPPAGDSPVDALVKRLQESALRDSARVERWVALGQAWVRKARSAQDPGFYLSADGAAEVALSLAADAPSAQALRALVLLNGHRFAEAKALAQSILVRHPDDLQARGALSDAALELGEVQQAAAAAQRMMDLKPNLPSYSRAAYLRWLTGDSAGAKALYRWAIDSGRDPRDIEPLAWTVVQAAMVFWQEGDLAGAEAGFSHALKLFPDYPPALVGRGRVALARGAAREAAEVLERAYRLSPLVETAALWGDARWAMGDPPGAEEIYRRVVQEGRRRDPLALGVFYASHRRGAAEAVQLLEAERRQRPNVYVEDAYGWALYRAGKLKEARAASDRAMALGTPDARLLFHAGAIRMAQGDAAGGRERVRAALALNRHFDLNEAAEAAELLDDAREGAHAAR